MEKKCGYCKEVKKNKYFYKKKYKDSFYYDSICSTCTGVKAKQTKHTCSFCKTEYKGRKNSKFCSSRCCGLSNVKLLIERNKVRRKYPAIEGLTRGQVFYRYSKKHREKEKEKDFKKRKQVINYLGGKCIKCGYNKDIRALVMDHINSDGKEDRKKTGSRPYRYYCRHLEETKNKIQLLCANCNTIKMFESNEFNRSRRVKYLDRKK